MTLTILAWVSGLLGFALLVTGVAMINVPTAYIVAGTGLIAWSWLADRAAAAMNHKPEGG
jgi:hypothetical protein